MKMRIKIILCIQFIKKASSAAYFPAKKALEDYLQVNPSPNTQ
jgi:hypothetical protein